jgi:phosphoribosylamine--glycine ligase
VRIGIATAFACGVGVWKRLQDEGCEVRVWRGTEKDGSPALLTSHRYVGEGIVPLTDSWAELLAFCKEGAARNEPTLMLFDSSGLGKLADEARKAGVFVVGGGAFHDKLEQNRQYARELFTSLDIKVPPAMQFSSIDECLAFGRSGALDRPVYWKTSAYIDGDATHKCETPEELVEYLSWIRTRVNPNTKCTLEEKLEGFALSTARYWNGRAFIGPYEATLEQKAHMAGGVGPSTGCALNAVTFYDDDEPQIALALNWDALTIPFLKNDCAPGLFDLNAIVSDGEAHVLEFTPRFGWDSEPTAFAMIDNLTEWLWRVATGQGTVEPRRGEIALAVRLTVGPAPFEHLGRDDKGTCVGVPVRGETGDLWSDGFVAYQVMENELGLAVASAEGLVGLSVAVGDTVSELAEEILEFAKTKLRVPGLQYRVDVGDAIIEDAEKCVAEGFGDDLPDGMTK